MTIPPSSTTAALLGLATADALGVPYEFKPREIIQKAPCTNMQGYGTHQQPKGTWSDDSSLTFCLAESLLDGYNLVDMSERFIAWKTKAYWTAHKEVFDIGRTTAISINRIQDIIQKSSSPQEDLELLRYSANEQDNGNGSLMRILPLL